MCIRSLILFGMVFNILFSTNSWSVDDQERAQVAVDTRQGLLKVIGYYIGPMVGMARGQIDYDADLVAANAEKMGKLTAMIPDLFKMDTSGSGVDSDSLDGIWDNSEDFNNKAAVASQRAFELADAAKEGKTAFMQAFGAAGGACKSCHDDYRQKQ
jgi:cytochrome c556